MADETTTTGQVATTRTRRPLSEEAARCKACRHAAEHGWWGTNLPGRSHCGDCHRYWSSLQEGHCPTCCRHFSNVAAFDAHLEENGCRDPEQILRRDGRQKFTKRTSSLGETWALTNYRALPDFDQLGRDRS